MLLGSLAIGSVSLALAKTGAQIQGIPLYKYIAALQNREVRPHTCTNSYIHINTTFGAKCEEVFTNFIQAQTQFHIPVSLVTLLSCGKTSLGKLNLLEEVILIPKAGQRVKEVLFSHSLCSYMCGLSFAHFLRLEVGID